MRLDVEPAGAHCAAGGTKVSAGFDTDGNGVLDAGEVSGTPRYVCDGAPGATGSTGTNGLSSLISMTAEAAGANCQYGGTKVAAGLDRDGNGVLATGEVTATSYNCNGAPGAGLSWVDVTGTSVQAVSGIGYLADNVARVTLTLPTSPDVGDVIEVSGVGAGGWTVAQNASQSILTRSLPVNFTAQAGSGVHDWIAIASSADGAKLVALPYFEHIYTSTDGGVTWTPRDDNPQWAAVASSADGDRLVAVDGGPGLIYTSTDAGVTWTPRETARQWQAVASSADGTTLLAAELGGQLYVSTDAGVTWTPRETPRSWRGVAASADGTRMVAVDASPGRIYTSTDTGVTWTPRETARSWRAVASSDDGTKLVAVPTFGQIYTSTDAGVTWTARANPLGWQTVTSSADGSTLVAPVYGGNVYTSIDSGLNWRAERTVGNWLAVAVSADGNKLAAVESAGYISTSLLQHTNAGTAGSLSGSQYDAITLQYIGNGLFMPLGTNSYSGSFTVR